MSGSRAAALPFEAIEYSAAESLPTDENLGETNTDKYVVDAFDILQQAR